MGFNFLPTNLYEWVLFAVCCILIVMLLLYNKAILKCKDLIEQYVSEIKQKDEEIKHLNNVVEVISDNHEEDLSND